MHESSHDDDGTTLLTRCTGCGSTLIYPRVIRLDCGPDAAVERRCPDCHREDVVLCDVESAASWVRRQARLREQMRGFLISAR